MEKSPEHKKGTQKIDEKKDCPKKIAREGDIVFLGFYEAPSNVLPGPSRSSDTSTHSGPSSAMGPDGRMLNYEISPRIISPAQAPARYHAPSHQRELCFEIAGGKRERLKKKLLQKMKVARAQKFIRQKEMEDIDNEEEEVKYSKDEEEESNWEEDFKEGESCNQAREMNLECRYARYDDIKEHIQTSYYVTAPDFERTDDAGSPVLFSSLPSYQPGGGFENQDETKDSTQEEISVVLDINSDAESSEEVDVEAISSKSEDSFQEKQVVTISHKSCWGSPIPFNEESVEEICSGAFPCMWVYRDNKEVISDKSSPSSKEILSSSSELKTSGESDQLVEEETVSRQKKRCISSEEDEGNSLESGEIRDDSPTSSPKPFITKSKNRKYLSDSEDSSDEVMDEEGVDEEGVDEEDSQDYVEEIEMKRQVYKDFVDDEAELSGEELSSDENEDALSVGEEMEEEEVEIPENEVIEMGKIHLKKINADDDQLLKKIKNDFLDEGELHNEDGERSRKFKWSAASTSQDIAVVNSSDSEDDNKVNVDHEKLKWLKESANASEDAPDEQPPSEKKMKLNILSKNNISVNEIKAEKRSKVKRGSFLKKDEDNKNVPKDSAKKTSTTKGTLFGSRQNKPPEADEL